MIQNKLDALITATVGSIIEAHIPLRVNVIIMNRVTWELLIEEVDQHKEEKDRLAIIRSPRSYKDVDVYLSEDVMTKEFKIY